ncbi:CBD9-like protein, partial [Thozetella sp. PMI_491]
QEATVGTYTDAKSGIKFTTWTPPPTDSGNAGYTFGLVLPGNALTTNATEYIGLLRCESLNATTTGWCGVSHAGHMTQDLLLMAWPYQGQVLTSFRYINDYFKPPVYTGNATLTQISSSVNATSFQIIYRCQNCFSWSQDAYSEAAPTTEGGLLLGYAQAFKGPTNPGCPAQLDFGFHDNGYGQWLANLTGTNSSSYSAWSKLATQPPVGSASCTNGTRLRHVRKW